MGSPSTTMAMEDDGMEPFELRGNGLLLSVPTMDDVERIVECCQDPEAQRWLPSLPSPYLRDDAEKFVKEIVPASWEDTSPTWAIRSQEDRNLLGMVSVSRDAPGFGWVGFWVAPDARGSGVASRAVRLVTEYAFDPDGLSLEYLQWFAMAGNWASRRVAWATGFRFDGTIRGGHTARDGRSDKWMATLRAGEAMQPASRWLDVPELRGSRVVLRPFVESDADAVVEACSDPLTQHWLAGLPSPYTHDHALAYIHGRAEEAAAGKGIHWAAALPSGGGAVGSFGIRDLDYRDGGGEVGFWVHPAARGSGIATEALALAARHALTSVDDGGLGLRRLVISYLDGNDASRKVIERNGFRGFGTERAAGHLRGGTIVDLHWYDLISDDLR